MRAELAVIVVSLDDSDWLRPCLRTLFERRGDLEIEVVVVDVGVTGEVAHLLESEFPGVRLVDSPNLGFAHANNRGLLSCEARYVLFLNPDTEIVAGTMAELVAALDARPEVGLAGVRQLTAGRVYPTIRRFPNALRALAQALGSERSPIRPAWAGERVLDAAAHDREVECDWTVGSFMIARREALLAAGLLDERFFLYSEETDLCLRIKRAGWSVRHLPQMTIVHHAGKAGRSPRMEAQNAYARLQFARKHFSLPHRITYRGALILHYALRGLLAAARRDRLGAAVASRSLAVLCGWGQPPFGAPPAVAVPVAAGELGARRSPAQTAAEVG